MKKVEFKFYSVLQVTPEQLVVELNKEGSQGWRFVHGMMGPTGLMFIMERISDEDVAPEDIESYQKAQKEAELVAKFGPNTQRVPLPTTNLKI